MKRIWKISFIILIVAILSFFILCQINIVEASNFVVQANAEKTLNVKADTSDVYYKIERESLWYNMFYEADTFLGDGQDQVEESDDDDSDENEIKDNTSINEEVLDEANSSIYNMLFGIGVVLTVIIGGVLGIKFMIASAEEKADIKNAMIPYVIGCIVIFGAFAIWKIAVNLLQSTIKIY